MRWETRLPHDACVLNVIKALPQKIVQEQVHAYRDRHETAVAEKANKKDTGKIRVSAISHYNAEVLLSQLFHMYSRDHGIVPDQRMHYGSVKTFIRDNVQWVAKQNSLQSKTTLCWYKSWRTSSACSGKWNVRSPRERRILENGEVAAWE